jgi:hypothetical protein
MATKEEQTNIKVRANKPGKIAKIDKIINSISSVDIATLKDPEYQEVFNDKNLSSVVDDILSIVNSYEEKGIKSRLGQIDDDLMRLSALLVTLSVHVGSNQGENFFVEENLKTMSASIYARADILSASENISLTANDHSTISRILTKDERQKKVSTEISSKVLTNLYFSVRQFIDTLQSVSMRHRA